ncbi:MAG: hypothetical protein WD177_03380, partial [Methylophaga sp.]
MTIAKLPAMLQKRLQPAALMLLVLLILSAVAVVYFVGQSLTNESEPGNGDKQQKLVSQQAMAMANIITGWQQQASDTKKINDWPEAEIVCMIENIPITPQTGDCLPISYATLLGLRQAATNGQADVAVMRPGTDKAYVQIIRQQDSGYLLLALSTDILKKLSQTLDSKAGYWTVSQGNNANLVLLNAGDKALTQQMKPLSDKIA